MSIGIISIGAGNLGSIPNMLKRLGVTAFIATNPDEIARAEKLILPGVGAFDTAMNSLRDRSLVGILGERVLGDRVPLLGICLGMQLLAERSDEGQTAGLGWISGAVRRLPVERNDGKRLLVPHMGWNTVRVEKASPLFHNLDSNSRFYFVHSYYFACDNQDDALATTEYGIRFPSAVQKGHIQGVQFHPEKSHRFGLQLLRNFVVS